MASCMPMRLAISVERRETLVSTRREKLPSRAASWVRLRLRSEVRMRSRVAIWSLTLRQRPTHFMARPLAGSRTTQATDSTQTYSLLCMRILKRD